MDMEKYKEIFNDYVRASLVGAWSLFAFIYTLLVTFCNIPDKNTRTVDTVTGMLWGSVLGLMIGAYFTTSTSNQKKPTQVNVEENTGDIHTTEPLKQ